MNSSAAFKVSTVCDNCAEWKFGLAGSLKLFSEEIAFGVAHVHLHRVPADRTDRDHVVALE
jgi:hypothetical protein